MAFEIERKFLVNKDWWKPISGGINLIQGYLSRDPDRTVRVRIADKNAYLTVKGRSEGAVREEFEYPIPVDEAKILLKMCLKPLVEKVRYKVVHEGLVWEVDEFAGDNQGLILAELELEDERQAFVKPDWIGEEVTSDKRFFNSYLSEHPYSTWN